MSQTIPFFIEFDKPGPYQYLSSDGKPADYWISPPRFCHISETSLYLDSSNKEFQEFLAKKINRFSIARCFNEPTIWWDGFYLCKRCVELIRKNANICEALRADCPDWINCRTHMTLNSGVDHPHLNELHQTKYSAIPTSPK